MGAAPLSFGCAICRRAWWDNHRRGRNELDQGRIERIMLTGRVCLKRQRRGTMLGSSGTCFQYKCLDCEHVGYSAHSDVARLAQRAGIDLHPDDPGGRAR